MRLLVLPTVVMHHCCLQKYVPAEIINSQLAKGRSSSKTKKGIKTEREAHGSKAWKLMHKGKISSDEIPGVMITISVAKNQVHQRWGGLHTGESPDDDNRVSSPGISISFNGGAVKQNPTWWVLVQVQFLQHSKPKTGRDVQQATGTFPTPILAI